jgi:UDP-N-acetylglucosamine--N-acetylmuramyl-(pentapeptide) pyrophosphoryl-undecaprenol N-acetylglucosamine transferase
MKNTICFVAGHSGGHIVPALTLARQLRSVDPATTIVLFSTDAPLDRAIAQTSSDIHAHYGLAVGKHTTRRWYHYPSLFASLAKACAQSLVKMRAWGVTQVVSMGGYVSIPVCLAARLLGIPITLYELNAVPGKAVSFLARCATRIYVCFDSAAQLVGSLPAGKLAVSEYPIRFTATDIIAQAEARTQLGISQGAKVLLILGGSQGSSFLNTFVQGYLRHRMIMGVPDAPTVVVFHQAGELFKPAVESFYQGYGIDAAVFSYKNDLGLYYAAADIVVCRAGAGTLFELAFFGKRSLVIPLETKTTSHQVDNAYAMASRYPRLFTVYRQSDLEQNSEDAYRYLESCLA